MITANYDIRNDVLYLSRGNPVPCYSDELYEGILLRYSYEKEAPSGVTILDYDKYWRGKTDIWFIEVANFLGHSESELKEAIEEATLPKANFG